MAQKTLPGVREAIEDERWADVDRYAALTGAALDAYAAKLDQGIKLLGSAGATAENARAQ
jgi:N-acetylated-alpha-linked acidic dipeptidase